MCTRLDAEIVADRSYTRDANIFCSRHQQVSIGKALRTKSPAYKEHKTVPHSFQSQTASNLGLLLLPLLLLLLLQLAAAADTLAWTLHAVCC